MNADGVYWDEMSFSRANFFHSPSPDIWDGHSVQINPNDFTIIKRFCNLTLISQSYRTNKITNLQALGKTIVANTQPHTETESRFHFPRFVETSPVSLLHKTHLYCPLGLGDSINAETDEGILPDKFVSI